jgi:uncharacterized protein (TIGR03085 family)
MTRSPRLAQLERTALCDTALQVGEDRPTLCDGWDVKDLVVHLLVREGSPAALGIVLSPLAGLTAAVSRRVGRSDFAVLVEKLRNGPPRLSPYAVPKVDSLVNTVELYVHHEDIRRARPGWSARDLGEPMEKVLWSMLGTAGKGLLRGSTVGVTAENTVTGSRTVLKAGTPTVTVRGLPSEVTLFVFGRRDQAEVQLLGEDADVARLRETSLGI